MLDSKISKLGTNEDLIIGKFDKNDDTTKIKKFFKGFKKNK